MPGPWTRWPTRSRARWRRCRQAADAETALGEVRLRGEVARAAGQFRLFAQVLRDGGYVEAVIDHATAQPPVPDLRRMNHPLPGVAGVFAASNFPFAFSVAGGDTASALAAGCPVVVKAHDGHPRTSELSAEIIRGALPDPALLGLVRGLEAGRRLAQHPAVVAVGFTGSIPGGKAVQALIAERPDPIPFYGELGSVNPVVVLPSASREGLAQGFAASLTLGVGQFCTNPGLLFVPDDVELLASLAEAVAATTGGPMLTERMQGGFLRGLARLDGLTSLAEGQPGEGAFAVTPQVFVTDLAAFAGNLQVLSEECFGPAAVVVVYGDPAELPAVLERLDGSLTATIHATDAAEARGERRGAAPEGGTADLERLADGGRGPLGHAPRRSLARQHGRHPHLGRRRGHPQVAGPHRLPGLARPNCSRPNCATTTCSASPAASTGTSNSPEASCSHP